MEIEIHGRRYIWTGKSWYDSQTHMVPAAAVIQELNALVQEKLWEEDERETDLDVLRDRAKIARDIDQLDRAEKLIRKALSIDPSGWGSLAILCSILRAKGRPEQALDETEYEADSKYPPLLTSRAAALCDLERWDDAKHVMAKVLAMGNVDEEAWKVVRRIKANRPDLYE